MGPLMRLGWKATGPELRLLPDTGPEAAAAAVPVHPTIPPGLREADASLLLLTPSSSLDEAAQRPILARMAAVALPGL